MLQLVHKYHIGKLILFQCLFDGFRPKWCSFNCTSIVWDNIRLDFHSESTLKYHYNLHNWFFDTFPLYCSKCVKFLSTGVTVNLSLMSFDIYVCWLSLSKRIWMLYLIPFSSSFPFSRLIMEACIMARSSVATKLVSSVSSDEFNNSFCCVENWLAHKLLWWFPFFLQYVHALVELQEGVPFSNKRSRNLLL